MTIPTSQLAALAHAYEASPQVIKGFGDGPRLSIRDMRRPAEEIWFGLDRAVYEQELLAARMRYALRFVGVRA